MSEFYNLSIVLFYIPTILLIQKIPMIGLLMIPKTLAYVAMAVIAFQAFYSYRVKYSHPNTDQS